MTTKNNPILELNSIGQSIWYDNIQRRLIENGELAEMISRGEIQGVTSNPSIFQNAIAKTHDYDPAIFSLAGCGRTAMEIFYQLAVEDIRAAADLFSPLFIASGGRDGYVSLEVSPYLAHDAEGTINEAKRLWSLVNRPNLMVKIPATPEGIPAVKEVISSGINVNVTLIFSLQRYAQVIEAYLGGLEDRARQGLSISNIASVASFFISRLDTKIDAQLAAIEKGGGSEKLNLPLLYGKAAISNAKLAYSLFRQEFESKRFRLLSEKGARPQRPLWASTSTKNPAYRDVIYIEELIGPNTVNTVPPQTLKAFIDHGKVRSSLAEDLEEAQSILEQLKILGIRMETVTLELENEGVKSFSDAFTILLDTLDQRRSAAPEKSGD
jgi:transaldolase